MNIIKKLPVFNLQTYINDVVKNKNIFSTTTKKNQTITVKFDNKYNESWYINKNLNIDKCFNINGKSMTDITNTYKNLQSYSNIACKEDLPKDIWVICEKYQKYEQYSMKDMQKIIPNIPNNCSETVLGKFDDLVLYKLFNNLQENTRKKEPFNILMSYEWDHEFNRDYVQCAFNRFIEGICYNTFMRILLPIDGKGLTRVIDNKDFARVTLFELRFLSDLVDNYNNNVELNEKIIFKIFNTEKFLDKYVSDELGYDILFLTTLGSYEKAGMRRKSRKTKTTKKTSKKWKN